MANLLDFIRGKKPNIQPIQVAENGGMDMQATMELAQRQPKTPFERIFGRNIEIDTDTQNPTTGEITTERVTKFQPGMLNDIASGARENYTTGFAASNLQDNIGTEGQNKGLAYRIGEGAGTLGRGLRRAGGALGRFANTPLGRAAIMAGVVGATGGSGLQALAYGGTAGLGNQVNRMNDSLYRNQLKNLGVSDDEINSIKGYISSDVYKNISDTYKARWNKTNWGELANFNPVIAEAVKNNPTLSNSFVPASVANTILKGELTDAQIANLMARTKETESRIGVAKQNANANTIRANAYADYMGDKNIDKPNNTGTVRVKSPNGEIGTIPVENLEAALKAGYVKL